MNQKDVNHFIDKILEQQTVINQLTDKVRYLETVIDMMVKELERARIKK